MINLAIGSGRARSSGPDAIRTEVAAAAMLCSDADAPLAVTLEEAHLGDEDLAALAAAVVAGGADALCSSTGQLSHAYASDRSISILRRTVGEGAAVIAAGRIAGFGHAAALIASGADRLAVEDPWALLAAAPGR